MIKTTLKRTLHHDGTMWVSTYTETRIIEAIGYGRTLQLANIRAEIKLEGDK